MRNLFPIFMLITNLAFNNDNNNNNLINSTCRATPNYPLCLTTLQSDPRTSEAEGADLTTLGLVMVDAVKLKSIEIMENFKKLEKSNPELRLPLSQCYIVYYAVLHADVTVAVEALKRGVPKFAENGMVDVAVEAETCEFSFKYNGLVSPVSDVNREIIELSSVAKSIIRMLL
ncbi:cell wall / vacuolar inhibitor of fructosidase 1-like [Nicotiana sylvestris]|uniref:Cell wall / vacuolar inhibitor of fructosidase 1-like n=1 Tax=Nicotiana sylvestris TaxID=4096 RepID=A0A1U7VBH9_NICSY|nr:PREDICTED: cell wall / vacuolar inhibitor of fructosidase 1-like [Nicotiana sylvestris]